jgi:endoglucanase
MKLTTLLLGAVCVTMSLAAPASEESSGKVKRAGKFLFTGVNVAGGEFGNTAFPGQLNKDYTWPSKQAIDVRQSVRIATV